MDRCSNSHPSARKSPSKYWKADARALSLRAMEGNERAGQVGTEKAAFWRVDALSQSRLKGTATEGVLEESGR